jgi:hypothetical protein
MNSLGSPKCAGRLLMGLAAITSIFLITSCGNGNGGIVPINPVGFSNSSLTGTYVFSTIGVDSDEGAPLSLAGAFQANGTGGIGGGTMDVVGEEFGIGTGQSINTNSSYYVNADGRGQVTLNINGASFVLAFVLTSTSHGLVTEYDGNGTGSGTLDLQTALTGQSQIAGPYAFAMGGFDGGGNPFATVGAIDLDVNGSITTGAQDFNDAGDNYSNPPTGAVIIGSGTAPGQATFTSTEQTFDFYPIDATHFKLIETDGDQFLAGDAYTQTGATIPSAMAFSMVGGVFVGAADAGLMTYSDGTFSGYGEANLNGVLNQIESFTGTPGATGVGGRVAVTLDGFVPADSWVVYPSVGGLLMLETDENVLLGAAYSQTSGQTIAPTENYGLNLSAINTSGDYVENDIAQSLTTTSDTFSGPIDISDDYGDGNVSLNRLTLAGQYTVNSDGTGSVTTTAGGSAYINFDFFPVNSGALLLLETDSTQIGAGVYELQTPPSGGVAQARSSQSRMSLARPLILKPAARAQMAARHKR